MRKYPETLLERLGQAFESGLKELERENRELRRSNEIVESTSAFFGAALDPRRTKCAPSSSFSPPSVLRGSAKHNSLGVGD